VALAERVCEIRVTLYWRVEGLNSSDEFLEKRFSSLRRQGLLPEPDSGLMRVPSHSSGRRVGQREGTLSR
jgi:hypothetical protein